ncbi:sulfatase family protein [Horticoccus sp. 23ND18S-11]|uniref:sulfatase family protein n=1 Tax=Horticoccus sp. 23ND18S-11 TaxID=3391832 RepID=UPI0039C9588A
MKRCLLLILACFALRPAASAAAPATPPNILFAIADDWGVHAGAYGTKWVSTPHFDRVARDGILFQNAYTPNAKCAPSRAAILTGRNSWQLKDAANHICFFPPEFKGWGEALAENGWTVGHTTKGWGPGVAQDAAGKPRLMTGKAYNARKAKPPATGIGPTDYAANFDDFLDAAPKDKPWAFWYGAIEPHREYEFGSGVKKGGKKLTDIDRVPAFWPDNETVRHDMLDYAYEVEHFDSHLGRMLAALEKRGLLENTLVIVTSDHGMPFPRGKGSAYEYSNHVPFAAMWARGIAGRNRVVADHISFIDLAPTFIELAGLPWAKTGMAESPGRSLTDIFSVNRSGQVNPARDHVLVGMERHDIGRPNDVGYPIRGIVKGGALYLENFEPSRWPACNPETGYLNVDASPTKSLILATHRQNAADPFWALCFGRRPGVEFYDLKNDPDCVKNLATQPATESRRAALKSALYAELKAQGDPRMFGQGDVFDRYLHSNPAHRDFYNRYMKGEKLRAPWVSETDFEPLPFP